MIPQRKDVLRRRCVQLVGLTHLQRKRLWWRAQRMSFAWKKHCQRNDGSFTRLEWAKIVYRILIRHPEEIPA